MDYRNKKIVVAGAGKSGIAAVNLLKKEDAEIVLYDANTKLESGDLMDQTGNAENVDIVFGEFPEELIESCDLLVLSPGVPTELDYIVRIKERGVPVWGEAELGYRFSKGRLAAITGTNGKTTTTSLLGEIAASQFESVFVVGNIGTPCTEIAEQTRDDSVLVAEMSSFQLESVEEFHPEVSMILNITPDHLNRHHTMENYTAAKANIMKNQTENETCVLNYEDERLRELAEKTRAKVVFFSSERELESGCFLRNGDIIYKENGTETVIINVSELNIIGKHNHENAMAAILGAIALGISLENIRKTLKSFLAVEHRIEYTCTKNGVKYYNDSKGTNPDAAIQAVRAMSTPTILIGGGYDKHSEYDEWIDSFDGKVKELLLLGQTAQKIADCCDRHGFKNYRYVDDMDEAIKVAHKDALPGEAVLLSPACASWGMFDNYEQRGRIFKDLVRNLPE